MRDPLTHKRRQWAEQFKRKRLKGTPIVANAGVCRWYEKKLAGLVAYLEAETRREIKALFTANAPARTHSQDASAASQARIRLNALRERMARLFDRKAKEFAEGMIAKADKASSANAHLSLKELSGGLSLKTTHVSGAMREGMKAAITENVSLIRSIGQEHYAKVEGAVMRSITTGNGLQDLVPQLEKIGGIAKNRARFIALDQTRKANAFLARERMKACGVKKFEWVHSRGSEKPRTHHETRFPAGLNGGIYSFDDPPVIDPETGETGFPGQLINCKCSMVPVIEFDDEDGEE